FIFRSRMTEAALLRSSPDLRSTRFKAWVARFRVIECSGCLGGFCRRGHPLRIPSSDSWFLRKDMLTRRYTVLVADRSSGVVRRITVSLHGAIAFVISVLMLPILIGLGAKWSAKAEIVQLRSSNSTLQVENGNYRATTGELTGQIQSLEDVIDEL